MLPLRQLRLVDVLDSCVHCRKHSVSSEQFNHRFLADESRNTYGVFVQRRCMSYLEKLPLHSWNSEATYLFSLRVLELLDSKADPPAVQRMHDPQHGAQILILPDHMPRRR